MRSIAIVLCILGACTDRAVEVRKSFVDLGRFDMTDVKTHTFAVVNDSTEKWEVTGIDKSCGCMTELSSLTRTVAPTQTLRVPFRLYRSKPGRFAVSMDVEVNGGARRFRFLVAGEAFSPSYVYPPEAHFVPTISGSTQRSTAVTLRCSKKRTLPRISVALSSDHFAARVADWVVKPKWVEARIAICRLDERRTTAGAEEAVITLIRKSGIESVRVPVVVRSPAGRRLSQRQLVVREQPDATYEVDVSSRDGRGEVIDVERIELSPAAGGSSLLASKIAAGRVTVRFRAAGPGPFELVFRTRDGRRLPLPITRIQ